jgi:preprotein translocase subunit SecE
VVVEVKTMDAKKPQQPATQTSTKDASLNVKGAQNFISDIKAELKKITWTSSEELRAYAKIVVLTTFFFGMGIYVVDLIIQTCLSLFGMVIRLISG